MMGVVVKVSGLRAPSSLSPSISVIIIIVIIIIIIIIIIFIIIIIIIIIIIYYYYYLLLLCDGIPDLPRGQWQGAFVARDVSTGAGRRRGG